MNTYMVDLSLNLNPSKFKKNHPFKTLEAHDMRQAADPDIQMVEYPLRPGDSSSSVKEIIKNENSAEELNIKGTHIIRKDQILPISVHV